MSKRLSVKELYLSPVKSARPFRAVSLPVGRTGFERDHQWAVVDSNGSLVTQRSNREHNIIGIRSMCQIRTEFVTRGGRETLLLSAPDMAQLELPATGNDGSTITTQVWGTPCEGVFQGTDATFWLSQFLSRERDGLYSLIRMDDNYRRPAKTGEADVAFTDAYPFLIISEASLADLNGRLPEGAGPLPMNRFRPTIVIGGCEPYTEDCFDEITIGDVTLVGQTLCSRCPITCTNQETVEVGKEPLKTLAGYRRLEGKVFFGRNFNHTNQGVISLGDEVVIRRLGKTSVFETQG